MKITRAQKDAVISLLKEKINEKNEKLFNAYKATHEIKIRKEFESLIKVANKLKKSKEAFDKTVEEYEELRNSLNEKTDGLNAYYFSKGWVLERDEDWFVDQLIKLKFEFPKSPDFSKIERQLELDTLSKDFDLDKFIKKYLDD